jgi:glucose-6-phosphate 1-dehydrogenase
LSKNDVVRGQVEGYREQDGVDRKSTTETFVALRAFVNSPRWAGVPVFIRAGKSLASTVTEVVVRWKAPRVAMLDDAVPPPGNHLRFRIGPDAAIAFGTSVKKDGHDMAGEPRELVTHLASNEALAPYERLLGDAMDGDAALFARMDAVLESWRVVDPICGDATPVQPYAKGSWGPPDARRIAPPEGWDSPA